jgi:RNA polymerase sigma factor (sigma-70 family)
MDSHRKALANAARRLLKSRADAEDAVQDTYERAFNTFSDWQTLEPAWMQTVLRNIAFDRLRRLRMEALHVEAAPGESSAAAPFDSASECESAIRHLLRRVSVSEAAVMLLRDVFELDYNEIAELLDKSEPATRQILHRARARARGAQAHGEVEESDFRLLCHAIAAREAIPLMAMLQGITAHASPATPSVACGVRARGTSMLVHINGRYAIALVLDGVVLCTVPVGVQPSLSETV